jgi:hypothetical protein
MPTVFRFLTIIAILVALVYAAMFALVLTVKPRQAEMSERIQIEQPKPDAPQVDP